MRLTEIPNIDYNRDFQLSRLPNLKNSEVISQKPPKRENIITYDRNTTTDRTKTLGFTSAGKDYVYIENA